MWTLSRNQFVVEIDVDFAIERLGRLQAWSSVEVDGLVFDHGRPTNLGSVLWMMQTNQIIN